MDLRLGFVIFLFRGGAASRYLEVLIALKIGYCKHLRSRPCRRIDFHFYISKRSSFRPLAFSMTSLGPSIVNDFHSIEGDQKFGLKSVPILIGAERAKWIASIVPNIAQFSIQHFCIQFKRRSLQLLSL